MTRHGATSAESQPADPEPHGEAAAPVSRIRRGSDGARRVLWAARSTWDDVLVRLGARGLDENAILLTLAVAVGLVSAGGVILFYRAVDASYWAFYQWPSDALPQLPLLVYRPLLTAIAFAVAWNLWRRLGRGDDGLTVPDVQRAVVRRGGHIPLHQALSRTLASAVTIGGGGSAGSEGPVAVRGAALGSSLGRGFRFSAARTTVLVGAGAAAGISAAFNAPLAGAFFALEELLGSLRATAFAPVVVASVVGAVVSRAVFGNHPAFPIPQEYGYTSILEVLLAFPLLGAACGVVSALFVRTHFGVGVLLERAVAAHPRLAPVLPWIAGLVVGGAVVGSGGLLVGVGHLSIPIVTFGQMAWWALLLLAVGKALVTSITLQGGGSGGLFTPSLFVGAAVGGAIGVALRTMFPGFLIAPEAYALVGMGAVVAATTGAPITAILLVFEMTNDYAIVPPLMVGVVVCHVVARRIERDDLYSGWLRRRGEHLAHGADRDVLATRTVLDACDRDAIVVREDEPVSVVLPHLGHRDQGIFPVVDGEGRLVGALTAADLGAVAREGHALDQVLLAADLAQPTECVAPTDSLLVAVRRMGVRGVSALPVVDADTGRLLGVVHRGSILAVYENALALDTRRAGS